MVTLYAAGWFFLPSEASPFVKQHLAHSRAMCVQDIVAARIAALA